MTIIAKIYTHHCNTAILHRDVAVVDMDTLRNKRVTQGRQL